MDEDFVEDVDLNTDEGREDLLENDEIDGSDDGFVKGFNDEIEGSSKDKDAVEDDEKLTD